MSETAMRSNKPTRSDRQVTHRRVKARADGDGDLRALSANELRRIAEAVDGQRNCKLRLVKREGEDVPRLVETLGDKDTLLLDFRTDDHVPPDKKKKLESIRVRPAAASGRTEVVKFDALFWSESSIEKFVMGYYVRSRTPDEVQSLWNVLTHPSVMAVAHDPLSDPNALTADSAIRLYSDIDQPGQPRFLTIEEFQQIDGKRTAVKTSRRVR